MFCWTELCCAQKMNTHLSLDCISFLPRLLLPKGLAWNTIAQGRWWSGQHGEFRVRLGQTNHRKTAKVDQSWRFLGGSTEPLIQKDPANLFDLKGTAFLSQPGDLLVRRPQHHARARCARKEHCCWSVNLCWCLLLASNFFSVSDVSCLQGKVSYSKILHYKNIRISEDDGLPCCRR